ncbi:MAG: AbrB/MazE/SpoVT family DNA-binding domain-containing protein [Rubrobacter sp.]|nr:AbrB/MazE/SpoVT family DNA-binding domain-containing protein [Rubrobacter sp.]
MPQYRTRITSKGQVTIPKAVRERYGLEEGDYLVLEPKGEDLLVRKGRLVSEEEFSSLAGRIAERFEDNGVSRSDVEDAIRWARGRP